MVRRPLGNHHDRPDTLLVTSDTQQTDRAALEGDKATEKVQELIGRARVVLWDFDGPVCRLFAGYPAANIAAGLVERLELRGLRGLLSEVERDSPDPHAVLRAVDSRCSGSDLVVELEEWLTEEELTAATSAQPTPYADPLIRTWVAVGARMAITTNNSPRVVGKYLAGRELSACFAPHVYGRTADLQLLKPDPHCLNKALRAMGSAPEDALMIGDTPTDLEAARRAGVPFLGYARNDLKGSLLRDEGAEAVVTSLEPVLVAVRKRA
ncbi:HAD family hydrolase [Streptomyces sp. V2]|nr:HAD family hydrolase [Streptomyces sp. V2]